MKLCLKGSVQGVTNFSGRAVLFQKARFVLPHATCDLVDGLINASVHICRFRGSIDCNVICAEEYDLSPVTSALDIQNGPGLDNFRIVEMQACDLPEGIRLQGVGGLFVTDSYGNMRVEVRALHGISVFGRMRKDRSSTIFHYSIENGGCEVSPLRHA